MPSSHCPDAGLPSPCITSVRPEEAREVSTQPEPCVLVASGGMCEGGRIMQHLRLHIDDPRTSIVLVSYQAPHSLGAQLLQMRPTVRFHGRNWNKWAEIVSINGFSGHADQDDFLALLGPRSATPARFVSSTANRRRPRRWPPGCASWASPTWPYRTARITSAWCDDAHYLLAWTNSTDRIRANCRPSRPKSAPLLMRLLACRCHCGRGGRLPVSPITNFDLRREARPISSSPRRFGNSLLR